MTHHSFTLAFQLGLYAGVGFLTGIGFFMGLWWTIRESVLSKYPARLFFTSFWLRIGLAVIVFYFVSQIKSQMLIVSLIGFVLARTVSRRITEESSFLMRQINHANQP